MATRSEGVVAGMVGDRSDSDSERVAEDIPIATDPEARAPQQCSDAVCRCIEVRCRMRRDRRQRRES